MPFCRFAGEKGGKNERRVIPTIRHDHCPTCRVTEKIEKTAVTAGMPRWRDGGRKREGDIERKREGQWKTMRAAAL